MKFVDLLNVKAKTKELLAKIFHKLKKYFNYNLTILWLCDKFIKSLLQFRRKWRNCNVCSLAYWKFGTISMNGMWK